MLLKYALPLAAAAALGFGLAAASFLPPKDEVRPPVNAPASTSLEGETIAGLGVVEPAGERVAVASPLAGVVVKVCVAAGQAVKEGDPLFALDDRQLRAELETRVAALELERAKIARLRSLPRRDDLPPMEARVEASKGVADRVRELQERAEQLGLRSAVAVEEVHNRRHDRRVAEANLSHAEADLRRAKAVAWPPEVAVAEAEVAAARAAAMRVQADIDRLVVRAPTAGTVLKVGVRAGEYADASRAGEPLIAIGPEGPPRVRVQVDEEDAGRVAAGQRAEGFVRGRKRQRLGLRFVRIEPAVIPKPNLRGSASERVDTRVLEVVYEIHSQDGPVYVGQQVDVFIGADPESPASVTGPGLSKVAER